MQCNDMAGGVINDVTEAVQMKFEVCKQYTVCAD